MNRNKFTRLMTIMANQISLNSRLILLGLFLLSGVVYCTQTKWRIASLPVSKLKQQSNHKSFLVNKIARSVPVLTNETSKDSPPPVPPVYYSPQENDTRSLSVDTVMNKEVTQLNMSEYGKIYSDSVKRRSSLTFNYPAIVNDSMAVRVWVYSDQATTTYPILFVVEEPRGILSWQVPLALQNEFTTYYYPNVSRTLCPYGHLDSEEYSIQVSTFSNEPVNFSLRAVPEPFSIELAESLKVSVWPSKPRYFRYTMPEGVDSVIVRADSDDDVCMILSVQSAMCPVFDLLTSVVLRGRHQTVTRKGAITLQREPHHENSSYFVVMVVTPSDFDCRNEETVNPMWENTTFLERMKNITVSIQPSISRTQSVVAILAASLLFAGFYVLTFIIITVYNCWRRRRGQYMNVPTPPPEISEASALTVPVADTDANPTSSATYGAITSTSDLVHRNGNGRSLHQRSRSQPELQGQSYRDAFPNINPQPYSRSQGHVSNEGEERVSLSSMSSLDETDIDMCLDVDRDKDIIRTKTFLYLSDLSRKPRKRLSKKLNLYPWNLITLAVFYALPVIQLVLTYQKVLNRTGDEDTCYYNFECAHPVVLPYPKFRLTTFNNVFSNIGYVSLGILFLFIVYRRDRIHHKQLKTDLNKTKHYGIPQHFGLFYCMGIALTMMGILSACYHICPSYNNFQFDTSFMYVLSWILMLRIYQTRHPDINPHAHTAYFVLALAIFFVVIGVVYGTIYFWVLFVLVYCTFYLLVSIHVYYMGRYKLNFGLFKRIYNLWKQDGICCVKPTYFDRLILLLIGNFVNWFFAIFGCVVEPTDFASYMLSIFIINLLMYFAFYIVMKIRSGERLMLLPVVFTLISVVLWGFAFYFFMKRVTSWQVAPALSRQRNSPCILLDYYDSHDVWHFLSSMSMFFSFNMLLTLDDDLVDTPRDSIRVF